MTAFSACTTGGGGGYVNPLSNAVIKCETKDAEEVTETGATLCGHLSVEDGLANVANAWFVIGTKEITLEATGKKVTVNSINLVDGGFDGDIEAEATNLKSATTYYYIACASVDGKISKGDVKSFTTGGSGDNPGGGDQDKPSVQISTGASGSIKENYATLSGTITLKGGASVEAFGVMFSTNETPLSSNSTKSQAEEKDASGNFTIIATDLVPATKYFYRAYYIQDGSTTVADAIKNFTTASPSIETFAASDIDMTIATVSGKLTTIATDLGAEVWFLYGTGGLNTVDALMATGTKAASTLNGDGSFSTGLSGLEKGYTYHYVAVTKIAGKEFYGSVKSFKTIGPELSVSVTDPESVWSDSATGITCSYEVVRPGDSDVVSGLFYCTHSFDTAHGIPEDAVVFIEGPKSYNIKRIATGKTYYYAAFAGFGDLVFYSEVKSFSTPAVSVSLTEFNISNISATSADVSVKVTANHIPPIFLIGSSDPTWFGPILIYKEGGLSSQELKSWNGQNDPSYNFYGFSFDPTAMSISNGSWSVYWKAAPTPLKPALKPNTYYGFGIVYTYQNLEGDAVQFFHATPNAVINFTTPAE